MPEAVITPRHPGECPACSEVDVWVDAGLALQGRRSEGYANGRLASSIETTPPHGLTGVYQHLEWTQNYDVFAPGGTPSGTCSVVITYDYVGELVIPTPPVHGAGTSGGGCSSLGEGYYTEFTDSTLTGSGEITEAELISYVNDNFGEWLAAELVPGLDSGSGLTVSTGYAVGLQMRYQLQAGFEDFYEGVSIVPVAPIITLTDLIAVETSSDARENEIKKAVEYTAENYPLFRQTSNAFLSLPYEQDVYWQISYRTLRFNLAGIIDIG